MDFKKAAEIAKQHIKEWLPDGHVERGNQWVCKSPSHDDKNIGNFSVNLDTGEFNDYADPDFRGHDAVSLYAKMNGLTNYQAADYILCKYDPAYFPDGKDNPADYWYQLKKGHRNAPELPEKWHGFAHWPLEVKCGDSWRVAMWITRYKFEGEVNGDGKDKKLDCPYTLWTDGKNLEWRKGKLQDCKYPLYGLRRLSEHPNARVVLYEGQKTAAAVQPVLGDDWVCVGWYGGAGNSALSDFEPLTGREVWYPFDADMAGRNAITAIMDHVHAKLHIVYPPVDVPKGWDHADAVKQGYTKEQIEALLLADNKQIAPITPLVIDVPDNRPTNLESPVSDDLREHVQSVIMQQVQDRNGNMVDKIRQDWFFRIIDLDNVLKSCIKYDYTTGIKSTAYDNMDIFDAALEIRLENLGIKANMITRENKSRMVGRILKANSNFNRVVDYVDALSAHYPAQKPEVLDEFMKIFTFDTKRNFEEPDVMYEARCKKEALLYREMFDHFFTRMHAHINGTRKTPDGEFVGLIENDIVPILTGPQRCGKTSLCRWLACDPELYIDLGAGLKSSFGSSETAKLVRGKMMVEIGEMGAMKNADDVRTVKAFVSATKFNFDIKYVEGTTAYPVTSSYIGTSNPDEYLTDDTGNMRFWPVSITKIDLDYLRQHDDLRFRLNAYYAQKTRLMKLDDVFKDCAASDELVKFMDIKRNDAMVTYSDYEVCLAVIGIWKSDNRNYGSEITQAEIERIAIENKYTTRISRKSCRRAFVDCGFVQKRMLNKYTGKYSNEWVWEEKEDPYKLPF